MNRLVYLAIIAASAAALPANAQDSRAENTRLRTIAPPVPAMSPETVEIDIRAGGRELWSGTLTLGPQYGNASFNQSKNEFVQPCARKPSGSNHSSNSNTSLNFNMSRANWQQQPDQFNVNFSWTRPLPPCDGRGTDTFGFNRMVEIGPGGSVTIEGVGGVVARISRSGR